MAKRNGGIIGPSNVPTGQYGGTASGVWRLRDAFNYIKAGLWPGSASYPVGNSLRFEASSNDYLSRTQGTPTSNQKFTVSTWYKRTKLDVVGDWWSIGSSGDGLYVNMKFDGSNNLIVVLNDPSAYYLFSSAVFRDVSAWYHIMLAVDTTQATASNRARVYINGSEITAFSTATYPTQNYTFPSLASGKSIFVGNRVTDSNEPLRGYLADYYFIDGQQLTPSSFGQTDSATGIWTPLPYYGTYGTNGFFLKFANSAALGTDSSGNGNNLTVNNLTSVDQSTDTPTNNFTTLNSLTGIGTFSEGNLQYTTTTTDGQTSINTISISSGGKWYCEAKMISKTGGSYQLGISNTSAANFTYRVLYREDGQVYVGGTLAATYATFTTGDIIGMAFDSSTLNLSLYKNGTLQGTVTAPTLIASVSQDYFFGSVSLSGGQTFVTQWNFGSPMYSANNYTDGAGYGNFSYAVPSGYYALNTKNLAIYG
jgi:hypothetical protein